MESEPEKRSGKHVSILSEVSFIEGKSLSWGRSSTSSSSSASSSLDLNFGEKDAPWDSSSHSKSEQPGLGSEIGMTSVGVSAHSSVVGVPSRSQAQSPPIQSLGKPPGYDPNRIPAAVFSGKPATPIEWSVASNDSLFSIQMGTNSFSRDLPILLAKSQELNRSGDIPNFPVSLPPVTEAADTEKESALTSRTSVGTKVSTEAAVVVPTKTEEHRITQKMPPTVRVRSSVTSSQTDADAITPTFAFPVLAGESESVRNNFEKVEVDSEKQTPKPQIPEATATPKAAGCNWFSCFSCCPVRN